MRRRNRWLVSALAATGLTGCLGDQHFPVLSPAFDTAIAPDGYSAPVFHSSSDVPPDYYGAEVRSHSERIDWNQNQANAYASMEYYGNRGEITFDLSILAGYSTVGAHRSSHPDWNLVPAVRRIGQPLQYAVPNPCGQVANLSVQFRATVAVIIETAFTTVSADHASGQARAFQPPCEPDESSCSGGGSGPGGEPILSTASTFTPSLACTGGGGTDAGGTTYRCYTVRLDHYWYHPDTDTYEYRYSEKYTYCEETA